MLTPTASAMTVPSTAKISSPSLLSQLTKSIRNVLNYPEIYGAVTGALVGYTFANQESAHSHNALDGAIAGVAGAAATRLATPILDWQANRENRATLRAALITFRNALAYAIGISTGLTDPKEIDAFIATHIVDNKETDELISNLKNEECHALLKDAAKQLDVSQKVFSNIVKDASRSVLKKDHPWAERKLMRCLNEIHHTAIAMDTIHELAKLTEKKSNKLPLTENDKHKIIERIKKLPSFSNIKTTFINDELTGNRIIFFCTTTKEKEQLEEARQINPLLPAKDFILQKSQTFLETIGKEPKLTEDVMQQLASFPLITESISTYKKMGLPFIMLTRGKNSGEVHLLNDLEIHQYEAKLHTFSDPLHINEEPAQTSRPARIKQKRSQTTQIKTEPILIPKKTSISYKVDIGPIAATQMAFANFPENAMQQVNKVIDDIEGGRITTKKVEGKYIYDIPLDKAQQGGRGAWRIAFETAITRDQETKEPITTFTLVGFIDYHGRGKPKFWGL